MLKGRIILAAGGTGGHVFPAQALAETLVQDGWRVFLVTDKRGDAFANGFPSQVQKLVLKMGNPDNASKYNFIRSFLSLIKSLVTTLRFFVKVDASIIVGFGGYPTATSMVAARILRITSVIHEQNAILGRVNRIFRNQAKLLVFGLSPRVMLKTKAKTLVLGNPLRESVKKVVPTQYSCLPSRPFFILVVGGSQGANFVSSIACEAILGLPNELKREIIVSHQCRPEYVSEINFKYAASNIKSETKSFFYDISSRMNKANLIVGRAGASSLAEFCFFGRPSILIPLPSAIGNHQALNAAVMETNGASIVLDQNCMTSNLLSKKISLILGNYHLAEKMAHSAKKLSQPNATVQFADELKNLENMVIK